MTKFKTSDVVLIDYVEGLPTTIKDVVLARCCMAFDKLEFGHDENLLALFTSIIQPAGRASPIGIIYECAKMIGVISLALETGTLDYEAFYRHLHEQTGGQMFNEMSLRAPLADKHWQAAREQFQSLLEGPLSPPSLRSWQDQLMVKQGRPGIKI